MKRPCLEVTFRKGKPLAAYVRLPRSTSAKAIRSEERAPGLVVDFAADGAAIGIEMTSPSLVDLATVNRLLHDLGVDELDREDLAHIRAA